MKAMLLRLLIWVVVLLMACGTLSCPHPSRVAESSQRAMLIEDRVPKDLAEQCATVLVRLDTGEIRVVSRDVDIVVDVNEARRTFETMCSKGDARCRTISFDGRIIESRTEQQWVDAWEANHPQKVKSNASAGSAEVENCGILPMQTDWVELADHRILAADQQDLYLVDKERQQKERIFHSEGFEVTTLTNFPAEEGKASSYALLCEVPYGKRSTEAHLIDVAAKGVVATYEVETPVFSSVLTPDLGGGLWILYSIGHSLELYSFETKERRAVACQDLGFELLPDSILHGTQVVCRPRKPGFDAIYIVDIQTGKIQTLAATKKWQVFQYSELEKGKLFALSLVPMGL